MYILVLCILIVCCVAVIILMPKFTNKNITNFFFFIITYISYLSLALIIYLDVGFNDWNFQNVLPTANVSPFMFFIMPIYFILPKKLKQYFLLLISLLSVGMFLSPCVNCIYFHSISYAFHIHFVLDYIAHFSLFLWGIYIIKSHQVELNIKNTFVSAFCIISVATIMLILNVIFDTTFFGLSLNGKHTIYNQILVSNSYLSALIYFIGLIVVLLLGYTFQFIINKFSRRKNITKK